MKQIDQLTSKQEALFVEYERAWTAIGLSTDTADRQMAESAIVQIYRSAGMSKPSNMHWCASPMDLCMRSNSTPIDCIYGQHDAGWLSFYAYCREVLGLVSETEELVGHMRLAQSAGWACPKEDQCWVSERPCEMRTDADGNLHSLDSPALRYRDGFEIYAVRGQIVPSHYVTERETVNADRVLAEPNADLRAAWAEIVGWDKLLSRLDYKVLDRDPSHSAVLLGESVEYDYGELLEVSMPEGPELFLRAKCGTGRIVVIPVDQGLRTAREANAWTYGLSVGEFFPTGRT